MKKRITGNTECLSKCPREQLGEDLKECLRELSGARFGERLKEFLEESLWNISWNNSGESLVDLDGIMFKVLQEFTFKEVTVM